MNTEGFYIQRCLELAAKAWPQVAPNPMVGCVIVHKNQIVASGYHQQFGGAHAEVNAIRALPLNIPAAECELYVSLEPCSHHGKTPPCTDLIIEKGFKSVIIASQDPNPLVYGRGITRLKEAGIEVKSGVLEREAKSLNKRFYIFHQKKRPFITLKWAESADGFISRIPIPANRSENQISGEEAHQFAHQLRAEHVAILVGKNTVLADDPELSTRLVPGNNPIRVLLDHRLQVPKNARIFNHSAKTLVFNVLKEGIEAHIHYYKLAEDGSELAQLLEQLHKLGIQSLLVEGGTRVLQTFLKGGFYDQVFRIKNPKLRLGSGVSAPDFNFGQNDEKMLGNDLLTSHEALLEL